VTDPEAEATSREIARSLIDALAPALSPGATARARARAHDLAHMLSLGGLLRALEVMERWKAGERPTEAGPLLERMERIVELAEGEAGLEAFRRGDRELAALAAELEGLEWSAPLQGGEVVTRTVQDVLADWPIRVTRGATELPIARLRMPVAAALRAALDWVFDPGSRRPLDLRLDEGALEVRAPSPNAAGLMAAQQIVTEAGGSIGPEPVTPSSGRWVIRVPTFGARDAFLMIEHAGVKLALPWHAVLRIQMRAAPAEPTAPEIAPFGSPAPGAPETPYVLVGLGLKRAWLRAERVIWRLPGDVVDAIGPAPATGWDRQVRSDEGTLFWLADPVRLLADIALPTLTSFAMAAPPEAPRAEADASDADTSTLATIVDAEPLPLETAPPKSDAAEARMGEWPALEAPDRARPGAPAPVRETIDTGALEATDPEALEAAPLEWLDASRVEPLEVVTEVDAGTEVAPGLAAALGAALAPMASSFESPAPAAAATHEATPAPVATPAPWRALVVEDSLLASMFLSRHLEQAGFRVFPIHTAAELFETFAPGDWDIVFVDVALPDAFGAALFTALLERGADRGRLVALVRDADDAREAERAGVTRTLRKPFEVDAVHALLAKADLPARGRS